MKTNNRKKYIIISILIFCIFFLLDFFLTMFTGVVGRPEPGETYNSITFKETIDKIPFFIFRALLGSIFIIYVMKEVGKHMKKDKDDKQKIDDNVNNEKQNK